MADEPKDAFCIDLVGKYMDQISDMELAKFVFKVKDLSLTDFSNLYQVPFLLIERHTGKESWDYRTISAEDTNSQLATSVGGPKAVECGEEYVYTIEKTERNIFKDMICLGRTFNNDIVISNAAISKLHACFKHTSEGNRYTITDLGSTNGTSIGNISLAPHSPVIIQSSQAIILGGAIRGTFFTNNDFYDYINIWKRFGKT